MKCPFGRLYITLAILVMTSVMQPTLAGAATPTLESLKTLRSKIAFRTRRDQVCDSDGICNLAIYTMDPDGSNQRPLIDSKIWAAQISLSPDATQFVFSSPYFGPQQLYLVAASGENLQQLTHDTDTIYGDLTWSPDNRHLGFTAGAVEYGNITHRRRDKEVYVMDADGSNEKALTNTGWNYFMFWSDDANSIIFMTDRSGNDEVYIMNKDGSNQRPYLPTVLAGYKIESRSPDRKSLILSTATGDQVNHLYLLDMQTLKVRPLIAAAEGDEYLSPSWSPDQRHIELGLVHNNEIRSIAIIDADGSHLRSITSTLTFIFSPSAIWSADSQSLLFLSEANSTQTPYIYRVDVNGNVLHKIPADNIDILLWES